MMHTNWHNCCVEFFDLWGPQEVCVDSEQLVVTTPAYMCEAPLHHIFDGIGEMISSVLRLVK